MFELSHDSLDQHAVLQGFRKEHLFAVMYDQFKADYRLPALPVSDYAEQLSLEETLTGEVLAD